MEKTATPADSLAIMAVLGGRVTTSVEMLPRALRQNRPTRAEANVAAEVIERLYAEAREGRRVASALAQERCDDARSSGSQASLSNSTRPLLEKVYKRLCTAQIFDLAAEVRVALEGLPAQTSPGPIPVRATAVGALVPVESQALNASVADLEALIAREPAEPLSPSEGESLSLVLLELKRLQAQAETATRPDPAVVSEQDLEALDYAEELVRGSGSPDNADRLARLHEVLNRVAQGREASHYRQSYERAVQRLVRMRELIPSEALRTFDAEWRMCKRNAQDEQVKSKLPEVTRGELRQMAAHCGAVSFSPPPLRAVRGVSLTFEQLEVLAALISEAVWPVPGGELR